MTSNERRRVAERLRELPSYADADGCCTAWDVLFALGLRQCDVIGFVRADDARRLADLIDPTTTVDVTGVETVADAVHLCECNECGHSFEWVYGEYEYCPRCGSRVVSGDGE